jgi:hypothetical protein
MDSLPVEQAQLQQASKATEQHKGREGECIGLFDISCRHIGLIQDLKSHAKQWSQ